MLQLIVLLSWRIYSAPNTTVRKFPKQHKPHFYAIRGSHRMFLELPPEQLENDDDFQEV